MVTAISCYLKEQCYEHVTLCVLMMMYDLQDNSMAQEDDMIEERFTVAARNTVTPNKLYFLGLTTINCLYSS